jgi:hypothetical protein
VDMLLQRLLHEDERRRIRDRDDGSRRALIRFDFGVGLLFNVSAAVVGMLKMAPNFVLSRLSPSTYLSGTPRRPKLPAASLDGHFEHPIGNNLDSFLADSSRLTISLLFV